MRLIEASEVSILPRGRKATYDGDLLDAIAQIAPGQAGVLDQEFGPVDLADRSKVAGVIRKHWERVHGTKCSIRWSVDGFPQVFEAK
jgi:hypothetical protein